MKVTMTGMIMVTAMAAMMVTVIVMKMEEAVYRVHAAQRVFESDRRVSDNDAIMWWMIWWSGGVLLWCEGKVVSCQCVAVMWWFIVLYVQHIAQYYMECCVVQRGYDLILKKIRLHYDMIIRNNYNNKLIFTYYWRRSFLLKQTQEGSKVAKNYFKRLRFFKKYSLGITVVV